MSPQLEQRYRLSPTQEGMLFHHLHGGDTGIDLEQIVCTLPERVDAEALRLAWDEVSRGHPELRARFRWEGVELPVQEIDPDRSLLFETEDWSGAPTAERYPRLERFLAEDRRRGFDLAAGPLFRLRLFRLEEADFRLVWSFHHALLDGRSFSLVLGEALDLYDARIDGRAASCSTPRPFAEFIEWLGRRDRSGETGFWSDVLRGFAAPTPLPGARRVARDREPPADWAEIGGELSAERTAGLQRFAADHGVTLNTVLQGAWALLLSRYSGELDVAFGATRAGRHATVDGAESMVGVLINTVPVRVRLPPYARLVPWLQELRGQHVAVREFEHAPLVDIQGWSDVPRGAPLFDSLVVFENQDLDSLLRSRGGRWSRREFRIHERTGYPLTLFGYGGSRLRLRLAYDRERLDEQTIGRSFQNLVHLLGTIPDVDPRCELSSLDILSPEERTLVLSTWNATDLEYPAGATVATLFEEQARRTPDRIAAVFERDELTYEELDSRAATLAGILREHDAGPGALVGICAERSLDMVALLLGVLKSGAAYVPLDPAYPRDRLRFMVEDSGLEVVLTQDSLSGRFSDLDVTVLSIDGLRERIAREKCPEPSAPGAAAPSTPDDLAYVIYTSGSTGKPKGVMVRNRSVVAFLSAMDEVVEHDEPGVWLAVTSISFDISVLELLWTLTRGFKVVVQAEEGRVARPGASRRRRPRPEPMSFSLFYFSSNEEELSRGKYRLLLEGARFADAHGFEAVWTPERHFHAFGGLYPNPSVTSAAIAAITESVRIRAGSVVIPLHHPIRVAEEWSVVDNLSDGRVGIAVATGWHADDFVFAPGNYGRRREISWEAIDTVRRLWRGEHIKVTGGAGNELEVRLLPRPIQSELPIWLTATGSPETFQKAGELGLNILSHLLGQSIAELEEKLAIYRRAREEHGHDPHGGAVTLMLHTFIGEDLEEVRATVKGPLKEYLKSSASLIRNLASSLGQRADMKSLSSPEMAALLDLAFDRYFETSGLLGTPARCLGMVERLQDIGVTEIACLIDFGIDQDAVLRSLGALDALRRASKGLAAAPREDFSIAAQVERHGVTHLQCTPSMARMLIADPDARQALGRLDRLLVGGEALPPDLAGELKQVVPGDVINMYGPTETTVWSTSHVVDPDSAIVPIGRPIAGTRLYVLDAAGGPAPIGVAGELYIAGEGVTAGYLPREELTGERFVAERFRPGDGTRRMYRTGDRVRYRPDGRLEFLGRLDHQVKIRGFRIELGEIESALRASPSVREALVLVREDSPSDQRLVAYVLAAPGEPVSPPDLRAALEASLPEYMIPAAFVTVPAWPLTPNGKIDRSALPPPGHERPDTSEAYIAPRDDLEKIIAGIWRDVLGVERVGTNDNFFDLGGHSLLMVQVQVKLKEMLGRDIGIVELFRTTTVSGLARSLRALTEAPRRPGDSAKEPDTRRSDRRRRLMQRTRRSSQRSDRGARRG